MRKVQSELKTIKEHKVLKSPNFNKLPQKQFELLYRQRDQSQEKRPMENIIFVKSKRCKPDQKIKKSKVKEQFKKIMKDLDSHINEHKKDNINGKQSIKQHNFVSKSSHMMTTSKRLKQNTQNVSSKKCTNKMIKTKKLQLSTEKINKNKKSKIVNVKSPRNVKKVFSSPNSVMSPKSSKFFKNVSSDTKQKSKQTKRGEIGKNKSVKQNHLRSTGSNFDHQKTLIISRKKPAVIQLVEANRTKPYNKKLRVIPLQKEEYLLMDGNFQLINDKCMGHLETKLLSTYRHSSEAIRKKSMHNHNKTNSVAENQMLEEQYFAYGLDSDSQFCVNERQEMIQKKQIPLKNQDSMNINTVKAFFENKIVKIQRWWRQMIEKQHNIKITNEIINKQYSQTKQSKPQNVVQLPHYPSLESITFGMPQCNSIDGQPKEIISDIELPIMIKQENNENENKKVHLRLKAIEQKRITHISILEQLIADGRIDEFTYGEKMSLIEQQYCRQVEEVEALKQMLESNTERIGEIENQIIQDKKLAEHLKQNSEQLLGKIFGNHLVEETSRIKENSLGVQAIKEGRICETQHMQNFQNRKKTQGCHFNSVQLGGKYKKKTSNKGQEYFEDFEEGDYSNDNSPHKALQQEEMEVFYGEQVGSVDEMNGLFSEFKQQQVVKMHIDRRIAVQIGAYREENQQKDVLDTSIMGLHQFLVNFFKFYLQNYKEEFLRLINMPYGYAPHKRLKFLQGYEDQNQSLQQDDNGIIYGLEFIISDDVLEEFFGHFYGEDADYESEERRNLVSYAKIHSKAAFDCFNEALNSFRPYFGINGPPYLWNCSESALTFYFISQENLDQVFEKTQFKVLKWGSTLNGIMVPQIEQAALEEEEQSQEELDDLLLKYQACINPLILQSREERAVKEDKTSISQTIYQWSVFEEQKTASLFQISSLVLQELALEIAKEIDVQLK